MLNGLIKQRRAAAQQGLRARVLLQAAGEGSPWTDAESATAFACRTPPIAPLRERVVTAGGESPWQGPPQRRVRGQGLDGHQEAQSRAWRLGPPPSGGANWPRRL